MPQPQCVSVAVLGRRSGVAPHFKAKEIVMIVGMESKNAELKRS